MKPSTRMRCSRQSLEEASAWFVDFRAGDIDEAAREEFHRWLQRSPENIQAYLEMAATYAELPAPRDIEEWVARARASTTENVIALTPAAQPAPSEKKRGRRTSLLALAASILLMLTAAATTWLYLQRGVYSTAIGEHRSLALADGSTVDLNSRTRIRVRYDERERRIELVEGQALFGVAKDAARPFVVESNGTRIRAVGTQFDVYKRRSGTRVTVIEGTVAVGASEVLLTAGEQLLVTALAIEPPKPVDIAVATAWTHRQLILQDTPLSEVAEEFNRYSIRPMILEGDELDAVRISGNYSSANPDSLVRFLRAQPELLVTETDKEIRVARR